MGDKKPVKFIMVFDEDTAGKLEQMGATLINRSDSGVRLLYMDSIHFSTDTLKGIDPNKYILTDRYFG